MNLIEYILWWFFGITPAKYGKRINRAYFYDTYHNVKTNKLYVLERTTGRFLER